MDALLKGYGESLEAGGKPFALAEHHVALRTMATARLHAPEAFWEKLHALREEKKEPPAGARKAIETMMPEKGLDWHIVHRSEEHTSELQSLRHLVCRLLLEK